MKEIIRLLIKLKIEKFLDDLIRFPDPLLENTITKKMSDMEPALPELSRKANQADDVGSFALPLVSRIRWPNKDSNKLK